MVFRPARATILFAVLLLAWGIAPGDANQARAAGRQRTAPDLFYNFYVPPGPGGGVGAQLYPCPVPTPPRVGHTYITYQPLMPHEFLYQHCRHYIHYHADGSRTRTIVAWQ